MNKETLFFTSGLLALLILATCSTPAPAPAGPPGSLDCGIILLESSRIGSTFEEGLRERALTHRLRLHNFYFDEGGLLDAGGLSAALDSLALGKCP